MKTYQALLLALVSSAAAFYGGVRIGLDEGAKQFSYSNGLLHAEMARQMLAFLDKNDISSVRGMLATDLVGGLSDHYELVHYRPALLLRPESRFIFENGHDQEFINRIAAYTSHHPDSVSLSFDPSLLPESTPQEREFKQQSLQGKRDLEVRISWVLSQASAAH